MAGQPIDRPISDDELNPLLAGLANFPTVIIAVSGGGDSLALLHLYARWRAAGLAPNQTALVATVDHGLRPESAAWARFVAAQANALGLPHETLVWTGPKPTSGLQDAARDARYRLMALRLASEPANPRAIVTAHTQEDQAETFLMRLARGSGLDGLAAMPQTRDLSADTKVAIVRPLLTVSGARLRATLQANGQTWIEDPANIDPRHERSRLRETAKVREAAGLSDGNLALSARRLLRARAALEAITLTLEANVAQIQAGIATVLDRQTFDEAPPELQIRLLERAMRRQGGVHPAGQLSEIERLLDRLQSGDRDGTATLGGCVIDSTPRSIAVLREPGRTGLPVIELTPGTSAIWDQRYRVALSATAPAACKVRALTPSEWAEVRQISPTSAIVPARAAITLPTFWVDGKLVAASAMGLIAVAHSAQRHSTCFAPPDVVSIYASMCTADPILNGCPGRLGENKST
jgi:tRNA(Ile)-lysidine synthase